jgi:hypothetical protein
LPELSVDIGIKPFMVDIVDSAPLVDWKAFCCCIDKPLATLSTSFAAGGIAEEEEEEEGASTSSMSLESLISE